MGEVVTAVNGFGRIGTCYSRIALDDPDMTVAAIAGRSVTPESVAGGLMYDAIHGVWRENEVATMEDRVCLGDDEAIRVIQADRPEGADWREFGDDVVVVESSGAFNAYHKAARHLGSGAARVLITAPAQDLITPAVVRGVNDTEENLAKLGAVVSLLSCSTNAGAPVLKELDDSFGVESAKAHTVHAETNSQRQTGVILPAATGSSAGISRLFPRWGHKFSSVSSRVPVKNGSLMYLTAQVSHKGVTEEDVREVLCAQEAGGIIKVTEEQMDSGKVIGNSASAVVPVDHIRVKKIDGSSHVSLVVFFDNEWGFSNRAVEVAKLVGQSSLSRSV